MSIDENFEDLTSGDEGVLPEDPQQEETTTEQPAEPAAETPEPTPEEPEADKQPQMVPYQALADERGKRQALEQIIQSQQRPQEAQKAAPPPDMFQDPEGYTRHLQQQNERAIYNARLDMSEDMARASHGDEACDAALEAARQAGVIDQFGSKRHPWGELVKWHQQQRAVQEIGDPATYRERIKAELMAEMQATQAAQQVKSAPPSMANETSIGGRTPGGPSSFTSLEDLIPE